MGDSGSGDTDTVRDTARGDKGHKHETPKKGTGDWGQPGEGEAGTGTVPEPPWRRTEGQEQGTPGKGRGTRSGNTPRGTGTKEQGQCQSHSGQRQGIRDSQERDRGHCQGHQGTHERGTGDTVRATSGSPGERGHLGVGEETGVTWGRGTRDTVRATWMGDREHCQGHQGPQGTLPGPRGNGTGGTARATRSHPRRGLRSGTGGTARATRTT